MRGVVVERDSDDDTLPVRLSLGGQGEVVVKHVDHDEAVENPDCRSRMRLSPVVELIGCTPSPLGRFFSFRHDVAARFRPRSRARFASTKLKATGCAWYQSSSRTR